MSEVSMEGLEHWIRSGDLRRAASALVAAYGEDVLATCIAMLRDRAAAEDVTQEVFGKALRSLATFRGDASPRTWLLSITKNLCIDHLRAKKRDPWAGASDDAEPDTHPDQGAFDSAWYEDRSLVLRALDALTEGDRALIVLRFKNGLEYDELANAFGLREGTVRMRVSRALARMRLVLESDAVAPGAPPAPQQMRLRSATAAPLARSAPESAAASAPPAAAIPPAAPAARAPFMAPPMAVPPSWWARLLARVVPGDGHADDGSSPMPPPTPPRPIGALGLVLTACAPAAPSEELARRLGALLDELDAPT